MTPYRTPPCDHPREETPCAECQSRARPTWQFPTTATVIAVALIGAASGHLGAALAHPQGAPTVSAHGSQKPHRGAKAKHEKKGKHKEQREAKATLPKPPKASVSPVSSARGPLMVTFTPHRESATELLEQATNLLKSGADITIEQRTFTANEVDQFLVPTILAIRPQRSGNRVVGFQVQNSEIALPVGAPNPAASQTNLARFGLAPNDVIIGVNGQSLNSPDNVLNAYARVQKMSEALIEVVRENRRVFLYWRVK